MSRSIIKHPLRASRDWRALRAFEQDTMSMYRERFAADVKELVRSMLGEYIGHNEARLLLSPGNAAEIESVGRRLIELGQDLTFHRRRSIA